MRNQKVIFCLFIFVLSCFAADIQGAQTMNSRNEQWELLYNELSGALARFGVDSPSGPGDFWLVDDDLGGNHHKICVATSNFWSSKVQNAISDILSKGFQNWGVYVVFEDGSRRAGFIVYSDGATTEPRWP
jgi:hypothetical protein